MKLKQQPEDFRVEEITDAVPEVNGDFAFYRLDKTGWTTPDALQAVRRRWQVDGQRLSYGGLKDRHAITSQYLTIFRGPRRNLSHERVEVAYLGQRRKPYTSADIRANRFAIVLRSLSEREVEVAEKALAQVARTGLPNYFDDQRFGSVGEGGEFVAREMVFGRFDRALWLALAAPYEYDLAEAKHEKRILRDAWGDWPTLKATLPKGHARSLVDYLISHPTDLKGAVARLRPDLQGMYLSAYQSHLWNRILAAWLTRAFALNDLAEMDLKLGAVPVPVHLSDTVRAQWERATLPLPSARLKPDPTAEWSELVDGVLLSEGLSLPTLKVKGLQKPFFSKGDRAACLRPAELGHAVEVDDRHIGRKKMLLRFDLARGSYATILVKRLTAIRSSPFQPGS